MIHPPKALPRDARRWRPAVRRLLTALRAQLPNPLARLRTRRSEPPSRVDLLRWRGSFAEGWTEEDIDRVLPELQKLLGLRLCCVWEYIDEYGCGGPSELVVVTDDSARCVDGDLWTLLVDGEGDGLIDRSELSEGAPCEVDPQSLPAAVSERGHNLVREDRRSNRERPVDSRDEQVTIRFHPQAWISDYAVAVDPEGPTTFRVAARDAQDAAGRWLPDFSYEADRLRDHPNAPGWIRAWHGPFDIEIERP